jgi:hypothetical protein
MMLELAEGTPQKIGYTFVPYDEANPTEGAYVRNDVLAAALNQIDGQPLLGGFFGSLWSGIKNVAGGVLNTITGGGQQTPQQPIIIQQTPPPADNSKMIMLAAAGLAAILLLKR